MNWNSSEDIDNKDTSRYNKTPLILATQSHSYTRVYMYLYSNNHKYTTKREFMQDW